MSLNLLENILNTNIFWNNCRWSSCQSSIRSALHSANISKKLMTASIWGVDLVHIGPNTEKSIRIPVSILSGVLLEDKAIVRIELCIGRVTRKASSKNVLHTLILSKNDNKSDPIMVYNVLLRLALEYIDTSFFKASYAGLAFAKHFNFLQHR